MTKKVLPSISVIIPTYNREKYLGEAIESILEQNYHPIEIIVIDDGSTDNTETLIKRYPDIQYIYQKNSGQVSARNFGIAISKGEYLAFLDSDDLWMPEKLHIQMKYMQNHPEIKMLFGYLEQFSTDKYKFLHYNEISKILPGLSLGTLLIRKKDFLEIGYLQTELYIGEFIEWFDRAKREGYEHYILRNLFLKRRLHDSNLGLKKKSGPNDFAKILRESLKQKRKILQKKKDGNNE